MLYSLYYWFDCQAYLSTRDLKEPVVFADLKNNDGVL